MWADRGDFTRMNAAMLKDLGYQVDWSAARSTRFWAGYRYIESRDYDFWNDDYIFAGTENLYYPDYALNFGTSLCGGIKRGYCIKGERPEWTESSPWHYLFVSADVFIDDPSINYDNVEWVNDYSRPAAAKPVVSTGHWCGVGREVGPH